MKDLDEKEMAEWLRQFSQSLADLMWQDASSYEQEWNTMPEEYRRECLSHLAGDIECKFSRLGDPYRGCSPIEYLAIKESAQEWNAIEAERHRKEWDALSEAQKEQRRRQQIEQAEKYKNERLPSWPEGMTPAEYVANRLSERKAAAQEFLNELKKVEKLTEDELLLAERHQLDNYCGEAEQAAMEKVKEKE